jgi:NAD(P)-dependent dehydrogenase (short-subunit alcohol dehydrogenase family)
MKKIVVITGAAGGIGHATAAVFNDAGWSVIGLDLRVCEARTSFYRFMQVDVAKASDCDDAFAELAKTVGHVETLVNNAAVQVCKPLVQTSPEEWDMIMNSNLRSAYLCVRGAYPLMRGRNAAIVNISSVHASATSANIAAYAASKGAMASLTRALAIELAADAIRVNAVLPGAVDTGMLRSGLGRGHLHGKTEDEMLQELGKRSIIGRVGRPEEIAQAILFLADYKRSSFITGQLFAVDGGALAKLCTE